MSPHRMKTISPTDLELPINTDSMDYVPLFCPVQLEEEGIVKIVEESRLVKADVITPPILQGRDLSSMRPATNITLKIV